MSSPLADTGERMMPALSGQHTFWEHVWRYRFAVRNTGPGRVLDVACGEGYGTASLAARGQRQAVGVDLDPLTCEHARRTYGIEVHCASALELPFAESSFDTVVSFETIEHLDAPAAFIAECARVLRPGGKLIISTPNRPVYAQRGPANAFHQQELSWEEFASLLHAHFPHTTLHGQCVPVRGLFQKRGWSRLRRWALQCGAPRSMREPTATERTHIVPLILEPARRLDRLDLFRVRPLSAKHLAQACYLIAVATKR